MSVTSVLGHLTSLDFPESYRVWSAMDPGELFTAELLKDVVDNVLGPFFELYIYACNVSFVSLIRL